MTPPALSFEFFPPNTPKGADNLWRTVDRLAALRPSFVSVTYGAGGTTQERTVATVARIIESGSVAAAAHLTCVGRPRDHVNGVIADYLGLGVRHIVALRGDPPDGSDDGRHPEGYRDAADLVAGIRRRSDVRISVAAYPEVHPRAASAVADLDNLKRKFAAGADQAITQFFFDADVFLRFHERARRARITQPIIPGIMPITDFERVRGFAERCGTAVPRWLDRAFEGLD